MAVKMILAGELADEDDVRRFLSEAAAAAGLDHPGLVDRDYILACRASVVGCEVRR